MLWIRIWIGPGFIGVPEPGSGSRKAKSAGCSLWRAEGFSCCLDVLYGGLGISKIAICDQKKIFKNVHLYFFFFSFWSSKSWIRIRIHLKCWIRNTDFCLQSNIFILQKNGAGLHTASSCYWDNSTDGSCTVRKSIQHFTRIIKFLKSSEVPKVKTSCLCLSSLTSLFILLCWIAFQMGEQDDVLHCFCIWFGDLSTRGERRDVWFENVSLVRMAPICLRVWTENEVTLWVTASSFRTWTVSLMFFYIIKK